MPDILNLSFDFAFIIKIILLIVIGLYAIFAFIIAHNIRSLNRVVHINKTLGSPLVQALALIYLLTTVALFIAAVVIL